MYNTMQIDYQRTYSAYMIFRLNNSIPKALQNKKFREQDGGGININHFIQYILVRPMHK